MKQILDFEDLHKKANEYKILCEIAGRAMNAGAGAKVYKQWMKVDGFYEPKTNFKGLLYFDGKEYVICYLGTDSKSIKDHIENLVMGVFGKSLQMRLANFYYKKCKEKYGFYNDRLTLVGHSEGGTEAAYTGIKNRVRTVTFNAFGLSRRLYDAKADYSNLITNYRDASDLVSKLRETPGRTFVVPSKTNQCFVKRIFGSIKSHKLENFGDCCEAVPVKEYMELHPFFINSYKLLKRL